MACTITFKGESYKEADFNAALATDPIMRNEVNRYKMAERYYNLVFKGGKDKVDALDQVINEFKYVGNSLSLRNDIDTLLAGGNPVYGPISQFDTPSRLTFLTKVWDYVKNINSKHFDGLRAVKNSAGVNIGKKLFESIRMAKKSVEAETRQAVLQTRKLNAATKGLSVNDKIIVAGIVRGDNTINDLSITDSAKKNEIRLATARVRAHIDQMTQSFVDLGLVNPASIDLYLDNKGKYVTRMYQSKLDPEGWWAKMTSDSKKPTPEEIAARAALSKGVQVYEKLLQERVARLTKKLAKTTNDKKRDSINATISKINGHLATREALLEFIKEQISSKNPIDVKGKSSPLKADFGIFKNRKDIPQEIRQLMGEIDTPAEMYQATIKRMAYYKSTYKLGQAISKGEGVLFSTTIDTDKGMTKELSIKDYPGLTDALPGVTEIYVLPQVENIFKGSLGKRDNLFGKFEEYNAYLKWGATVGNPVTQVRNFYSIFKFLLGNGSFLIATMHPQSINTFWESLGDTFASIPGSKTKPTEFGKFLAEQFLRTGAISSSVELAQFENLTESRNKSKEAYEKVLMGESNTTDKLRAVVEFLNKSYQGSDNLAKMFSASVEAEMRAKAEYGKTLKQLFEEAQTTGDYTAVLQVIETGSKVTKNTIPNYEETWSIVEQARKVPFFGVFIAFPMEQVRNKIQLLETIKNEVRSDNKNVKAAGIVRFISAIMSASVTYYGVELGTTLLREGMMSDDEEEGLLDTTQKQVEVFEKFYAAPWEKGVSVVFNKDGDFQLINTGTVDPDAMFRVMFNGLKYNTDKSWAEYVKATLEPVVGSLVSQDLATSILTKVLTNTDQYGRKISSDPNLAVRQLEKILYATRESLPGGVKTAFDIYWKDVRKVAKLEEDKVKLIEEIIDPIKTNTLQKKQKLEDKLYEIDKKIGMVHRNRQAKGKSVLQGMKVRHGNVSLQAKYKGYEYKNKRSEWRESSKGGILNVENRVNKEYERFVKDLRQQYWMTLDHLKIDIEKPLKDGQIPVKIMDYVLGKTDEIPPLEFK
jgi:hypothetical protein